MVAIGFLSDSLLSLVPVWAVTELKAYGTTMLSRALCSAKHRGSEL